jgi:hypothetical protein
LKSAAFLSRNGQKSAIIEAMKNRLLFFPIWVDSMSRGGTLFRAVALCAGLFAVSASGAQEYPPLSGDAPLSRFPETNGVRLSLADSLVFAPRDEVLRFKAREIVRDGLRVRASVERRRDAFYAVFSPERREGYPVYGQGSWIVKRSMRDGSFIQAKVFMRSETQVFIRLYPFKDDRTKLEFIAYGGVLAKDVLLPVGFKEALFLPVSRIAEMCGSAVDWSVLSPDPALYAPVRGMIAKIRAYLPRLSYADDGAVDSGGRAVFIKSGERQPGVPGLNCSGFVKWIVDGIYAAADGKGEGRKALTDIAALKARDPSSRGNSFTEAFEDSRDVYFGLDWTRNLARVLMARVQPGSAPDLDVRIRPFGEYAEPDDVYSSVFPYSLYPDWKPGAGYDARGLKAILYVLAASDPDAFYLASRSYPQGDSPELRQHSHVAAYFPYFDEGRVFRIAVFESAVETPFDKAMANAMAKPAFCFFHLVRLPADESFDPGLAMWRDGEGN